MGSRRTWTIGLLVLAALWAARWRATHRGRTDSWHPIAPIGECRTDGVPWRLRRLRGEPWRELAERAAAETGVQILFASPVEHEVRLGMHQDWEPVEAELRATCVLHAWSQLRRYEPEVLASAVHGVLIVRALRTSDGAGMHGFASPSTDVAVVHVAGLFKGTTLHHEIGHLLEAAHLHASEHAAWLDALPGGFTYSHPHDRRGRLDRSERRVEPVGGWQEHGFIDSYSTTAFEEDFASLFAWELACPDTLRGAVNEHYELWKKREILHDVLEGIDMPRAR